MKPFLIIAMLFAAIVIDGKVLEHDYAALFQPINDALASINH